MVAVYSQNGVVASVSYSAVVKQEVINSPTQCLQCLVIVFHDGLVWRVSARHHKRRVINTVEEHVVQARVGQHDADVVQVWSD